MEPQTEFRRVHEAIHLVMKDMAKAGVGKHQHNTQQNFAYRGVDDVMDALAPSLSEHGLIIVPHVVKHSTTERESRAGSKLFHTLLEVNYDFISVKDGSKEVVGPIFGEAMDSGDKATNKAMATAYKYACVQTFCIPITGDDPDAQSHEVAAKAPQSAAAPSPTPAKRRREEAPPQKRADEPRRAAAGSGLQPDVARPGGMFGYGKKYVDTPWNVMRAADLEWFLNADRTPQDIRQKIVAELAWRDYEVAQLEAGIAQERAAREAPLEEDIP